MRGRLVCFSIGRTVVAAKRRSGGAAMCKDIGVAVRPSVAGSSAAMRLRRMGTIFVDADACPVRDEVYRVARRYLVRVVIVANTPLWVPSDTRVQLTLCPGFGAVDDWIAEQAGPGDIVVTADIPQAARCLAKGAHVLDPKGRPFTENEIGAALATRDLLAGLRQGGAVTGGPAPMTAKDRSRFLSKLDEAVNAKSRADHPRP